MILTTHAIERARTRLGWSKKALNRMAYKALAEGNSLGDLRSPELLRYVEARNKKDTRAILHANVEFVFSAGEHPVLLTIFPLKKRLMQKVRYREPDECEEFGDDC